MLIRNLLAFVALTLAVSSQAAMINLAATIDGSQANAGAGTGSPGTGSAQMTLDDATGMFTWTVQWSDLQGMVTVAHFHGPAAPDQNAGVEVAIDAGSNPAMGMEVLDAQQQADLLAGLWYVNIHSDAFPSGEIRGQVNVVPLPAAAWLFGSAILGLLVLGRRRA